MLQIGVTGGIGSGKTTVCKLFNTMGIPVFNADLEARTIVNDDEKVIAAIKKLLGKAVYDSNEQLDRKKVAQLVFRNEKLLEELNRIVHPAVAKRYKNWVTKNNTTPYLIKEAAILFESGSAKELDKVIVVSAPEELRIKRVMNRDDVTEKEVRDRMARQLTEAERIARADYVISNGEDDDLPLQVMELHEKFLAL